MKPITIGTTRSGLPTAASDNLRIHSAYDPEKEADRFFEKLGAEIRPGSTIIIIGAGLGYLDKCLSRESPDSKLIAFHLDDILYRARINDADTDRRTSRWYPGDHRNPENYLYENLQESDIPGLRIIEWPASIRARPETASQIQESLSAVVRRHSGNISATAAFGRHWIRNTLRNFLSLEELAIPKKPESAVVLAASGPSLEEALPQLCRYRNCFDLWALPSSVPSLLSAGLEPDLIFATDPGYWARLHTRSFPRNIPVAMPLCAAALPDTGTPIMLIPQNSPGESQLLAGEAWPTLPLPEMGTVAATALEAWRRLGCGPLAITGLDLAWTDLRAHSRPHGFDGWLESISGRTHPPLTIAWERAMQLAPGRSGRKRTGGALLTYADWFASNPPGNRVIRYRPVNAETEFTEIPGIAMKDESWFSGLNRHSEKPSRLRRMKSPLNRQERKSAVKELLDFWKDTVRYSPDAPETAQLMYTLDPGGVLDTGRLQGERYTVGIRKHRNRVKDILEGLTRAYEQ